MVFFFNLEYEICVFPNTPPHVYHFLGVNNNGGFRLNSTSKINLRNESCPLFIYSNWFYFYLTWDLNF